MNLSFQDVIPCLEHGPDSILRQQLPNMSPGTVVCVATTETASSLTQQLRTLCFPVSVVSEGSRKNLEELFHKKIVVSKSSEIEIVVSKSSEVMFQFSLSLSLSLSLSPRTNPYGWEACHLCLLG